MPLTTSFHKLFVARQEAAASSTFSDSLATKGDFANKPAGTVDLLDRIQLDPTVSGSEKKHIAENITNGIVFYFAGGDAADDVFTWKIYGWRNENGPAELIVDGTGALGTQAVVRWPHNNEVVADMFWADTLDIVNESHTGEVEATAQGGNSVSKVWFDTSGYRYFLVEIPESVGNMACFFGYF